MSALRKIVARNQKPTLRVARELEKAGAIMFDKKSKQLLLTDAGKEFLIKYQSSPNA